MRGAMEQTLIGLAIGIPVVLACAKYVESQLFDVKGVDWRVMLAAVGALAFASLLAGVYSGPPRGLRRILHAR